MNEALGSRTAAWADCVVGFVAGSLAFRMDLPALARSLASAAWREGCPRAADLVGADGAQAYRRIRLRTHSSLPYSALLIAWPPGYASPVHDHDGLWGIDVVLDGVLEVEAYALPHDDTPQAMPAGSRILGVGDVLTFPGDGYAHRCRNLSERQPALSLHVYGGELSRYRSFHEDTRGDWHSTFHQAATERALL
jgi:predicted metal-dependent enzyme (double-stranded beta helix superfamily)